MKNRKVKNAGALAETVVEAAHSQHTALLGERLVAAMVARLAKGVMALDAEIAELDALIETRFHEHPHAGVIRSLPGMGALLGAEFIAATGGYVAAFGTPDRLASFAGLAPVPRDSGRVSGNIAQTPPLPRRAASGLLPLLDGPPEIVPRIAQQAERGEGGTSRLSSSSSAPGCPVSTRHTAC